MSASRQDELNVLTDRDLIEAAWHGGELSWKLHEHQRVAYDKQRTWEPNALEIARDEVSGRITGQARWWVDDWGRRTGKSHKTGLVLLENGIRRPGSMLAYASATEIQIKEIIIPIIRDIVADCPEEMRPKFFSSRWGMRAGFHFPAHDSVIKLVGLDKDPDGLRGPALDWCAISEAAFVKGLGRVVSSIIGPMFMRKPHARGYLESSAPQDPDHDFDRIFVPNAKKRGAYVFMTIYDNKAITKDEADEFYEAAASIDRTDADREYKGIRSRDFATVVFPEFDQEAHVREVELPKHAQCITAADPGQTHMFGLVHALFDADNERIVVVDSWAGRNASSMKVAAVNAAREFHHWGTWPHPRMKRIPLDADEDSFGWRDLLSHDRFEHMAEGLYEMAQTAREDRPDYESNPGRWIYQAQPDQLVWWSGVEHKANPAGRVSDVDKQLINDISVHYGLEFEATTKSELKTMVRLVRDWMSEGRIVFLPNCGPAIDHTRMAKWTKDRKRFDENPEIGHADVAAALVYLVRYVDKHFVNVRPHPPSDLKQLAKYGQDSISRLPWTPPAPHEEELERRLQFYQQDRNRMKGWRG